MPYPRQRQRPRPKNERRQLIGEPFGDAPRELSGIAELRDERWTLRTDRELEERPVDPRIPTSLVRQWGVRQGDRVSGRALPPRNGEPFAQMERIDRVDGVTSPEASQARPRFEDGTPIHPDRILSLEAGGGTTGRLLDLVAPIGRGQRALIVAPPKAGKTHVLKAIARGITDAHAKAKLVAVLVGERPEEVTDLRRGIEGAVYASTFDEPVERHTRIAELSLEIAKRDAEAGEDVVLLLDSLTRLARAYNVDGPSTGRLLSGGMDAGALYPAKRFFGAARCFEGGGSLTIVATTLIDTGSKLDDLVYEEFKGTGNSELHLSRTLAERRVFPAIDITRSGTRAEERLFDPETLKAIWRMRRLVAAMGDPLEATERLIQGLEKAGSNADFLASITPSEATSTKR
jgi:transcription termination factor Rho